MVLELGFTTDQAFITTSCDNVIMVPLLIFVRTSVYSEPRSRLALQRASRADANLPPVTMIQSHATSMLHRCNRRNLDAHVCLLLTVRCRINRTIHETTLGILKQRSTLTVLADDAVWSVRVRLADQTGYADHR